MEESGFKVWSELVEGLFRIGDRGICHLVIPHFRERDSVSLVHFVKSGHNLVNIRSVNRGVDGEVGLHSLDPLYSVSGFSRKICGEARLEFWGFGRHTVGVAGVTGGAGGTNGCLGSARGTAPCLGVLGFWGVEVKGNMVKGSREDGCSSLSLGSLSWSP